MTTPASGTEPQRCRMFPLGSVLVPGAPLPLHIFEPRYQALLNESLEDDRTFGVTLITRGHEVGGGDARSLIGTRAHIDDHNRFDDGRAAVAARGVSRIEVIEWLDDDPYPLAMVIDRPTIATSDPSRDAQLLDQARLAFDTLLDTAAELGRLRECPDIVLGDEPEAAAWTLASIAPIPELDRQRVLAHDLVADRLGVLTTAFDEHCRDLRLMAELDD